MQYLVMFTQYYEYLVEANSEEEAKELGYRKFSAEQRIPIADTHYDEVSVEPQEEENAD